MAFDTPIAERVSKLVAQGAKTARFGQRPLWERPRGTLASARAFLVVVVLLGTTFPVLFGAGTASATDNYPPPPAVPNAEFEPRWTLPGPTPAAVLDARDVASDSEGNFYLLGSTAMTKLAPSGDVLANWGSQGAGPGQLEGAADLAIREEDGQTVLYVLDATNCRVQEFTPSGSFLDAFGVCTEPRGEYGYSVASAGDVNGDGYDDVIVGAPLFDAGQPDEGRAFVYLGTPEGPGRAAAWIGEGNQLGAQFGSSVASAGDINGDGYDDVIVGAPFFDGGQTDEGRVFVYLGSSSGLSAGATWTAEADQASASFGTSVGSAGDVNGDGYDDILVGAPAYDSGQTDEGTAFLWLGDSTSLGPSGTPLNVDWAAESDQNGAAIGVSIASAGDVNGDGYDDVIIGARLYDDGQVDEGKAFAYLGSSSGLSTTASWTAQADQASALFGWAVASAGDVNGDGYDDVIVGAYAYSNPEAGEGRVYVFMGSAAGLPVIPSWSAESNQVNAYFGGSVASAGDVNGDGYDDVIVGAWLYDNPEVDEGRSFVYVGSAQGLGGSPAWTAESQQAGARFGWSAASAGDLNGDGYRDVVVGAGWYDAAETDDGQAFFWLGESSFAGNWDPRHVDTILPPAFHPWARSLAVSRLTGHVYAASSQMTGGNIYHFLPDGRLVG